jgi:hydrogenase maturation protease
LWWNSTEEKAENTKREEKKIIILGVGNLLLSDEGIGVHVAQRLMDIVFPPEVEIVEGGTDGFGLIHILIKAERLILIDALKGGGTPGSIYRFDLEECRPFPDLYKTSVHQISILEVLNLSGLIGPTPRTTIIGVEPKSLQIGMELSPEIEAQVPKVIQLVKEEVRATLNGYQQLPSQ